jgi:hypothetical protein
MNFGITFGRGSKIDVSSLRGVFETVCMVDFTRHQFLNFFINLQGIHKRMMHFKSEDMLENWLLPQLNTNYDDYILQLDGTPPHFHRNV